MLDVDELITILDDVRLALGEPAGDANQLSRAVADRHAVEAEIQAATIRARHRESDDHGLMTALAGGDFEISPSSNLDTLTGIVGKLGSTTNIAIDLDLLVDHKTPPEQVRVHLVIEIGFWRWTARDGCRISRNGEAAVPLPAHDGLLHALLGGLALRGGCAIADWADAASDNGARNETPGAGRSPSLCT